MGRQRAGAINQITEARCTSTNGPAYAGPSSRCVGASTIFGHVILDSRPGTVLQIMDNSMDWRDRLVVICAFSPATQAGGVPVSTPWLCAPTEPANNNYALDGHTWLTAGGWDGTSALGGAGVLSKCNMLHVLDRTFGQITFYADSGDGTLRIRLAAGQFRGITYWLWASEQLGFQSAIV